MREKRLNSKVFILCLLLTSFLWNNFMSVQADMGPKPSVVVDFLGIEDEVYYTTLLSVDESTGPWSAGGEFEEWYENEDVWEKMNAYSDKDGFYFLGCYGNCSETDSFQWSYYPPDTFKILIYFPEYDRFLVSEVYERYAFDSYFTVEVSEHVIKRITEGNEGTKESGAEEENLSENAILSEREDLKVTVSYQYAWEIFSMVCRIVITIILEIFVALLFKLREKKQLLLIGLTNVATQTMLNVLLNVIYYKQGSFFFLFYYIWLELFIFVLEGLVYMAFLKRVSENPEQKYHSWFYAFIANLLSFAAGFFIVHVVPEIF